MGYVAAAVGFALVAAVMLTAAIRYARSNDREQFWISLAGSLPFIAGLCFVLWKGLSIPES